MTTYSQTHKNYYEKNKEKIRKASRERMRKLYALAKKTKGE